MNDYSNLLARLRKRAVLDMEIFGSPNGLADEAIEAIEALQAEVAAAQPKTGTWEWKRFHGGMVMCSECQETFFSGGNPRKFVELTHFCPNCGAQMIGGEKT